MDKELIDYVFEHYPKLLGLKEELARRHHFAMFKTESLEGSRLKDMMLRQWGTKDQEALDLLSNGYEEFKRMCVEKIMKVHADNVFINNCPHCGRLARTPLAKQCRHCGHNWH